MDLLNFTSNNESVSELVDGTARRFGGSFEVATFDSKISFKT